MHWFHINSVDYLIEWGIQSISNKIIDLFQKLVADVVKYGGLTQNLTGLTGYHPWFQPS